MEHESHHHHHPHKTGIRWLDVSMGVAAAVVSLVSLWLGLHSAHEMEKLVASNSYPYVELMRSNAAETIAPDATGRDRRVKYMLDNNGVGPARIEWVQFNFKGKPVRDLSELMQACGSPEPGSLRNVQNRGGIDAALIRPGASVEMFQWVEPETPNPAFDALHRQMKDISYSACYCSVFDECYLRDSSGNKKPEPVEQCTPPAAPFQPAGGAAYTCWSPVWLGVPVAESTRSAKEACSGQMPLSTIPMIMSSPAPAGPPSLLHRPFGPSRPMKPGV